MRGSPGGACAAGPGVHAPPGTTTYACAAPSPTGQVTPVPPIPQ